jgi:hypothetical protein
MAKTWVLVVEITDDGQPSGFLKKEEIMYEAIGDLVSGLTGKVISCIDKAKLNQCNSEWQGGRNNDKYCKCVRPKNHSGAHSTVLLSEDVK